MVRGKIDDIGYVINSAKDKRDVHLSETCDMCLLPRIVERFYVIPRIPCTLVVTR